MTRTRSQPLDESDASLLSEITAVARRSGERIRDLYSSEDRVEDRPSLLAAFQKVEAVAADGVREALSRLRPEARWLVDDPHHHRSAEVRSGEWWIVDGVEGAVNFIHGLEEFSVNITLLRDNLPLLAVVYQPLPDRLYSAALGQGARLGGRALAVSAKTDLALALVTTSQAGGTAELNRRTAESIRTMFDRALAVRQTVPSTFPLLAVAAGHYDVYWRFGPDLPALAGGVLLATEAGATATDLQGRPWSADAPDCLVAPPGLHHAALQALRAGDAAVVSE